MPTYNRPSSFILKTEHLKLVGEMIPNLYWEDGEPAGSPCIDYKRPYGTTDMPRIIGEILNIGQETCPHCNKQLTDNNNYLWQLHHETLVAVDILLSRAVLGLKTTEGSYTYDNNSGRWLSL